MKYSLYCLYVILLMMMGRKAVGQPTPLPGADKYVIYKKFDVGTMGMNESFDQRYIAYFCDDITLENFNLTYFKWGEASPGKCKNVIIIANVLRLGKDNDVTLESAAGTEFDREGGSLIFICRKLVITDDAKLKFSGTSGFPLVTTFGAPMTTNYRAGYGAGLYVAAEELVIEDARYSRIRNSFLGGWNWAMENMKGFTIDKLMGNDLYGYFGWHNYKDKIFSPGQAMMLFDKYKKSMSPTDTVTFRKLLQQGKKVGDSLINMLNYLYAMNYDNMDKKSRLSSMFSIHPSYNSAFDLGSFSNVNFTTNNYPLIPKNSTFVDFNAEYGIPINIEPSGAYLEKVKTLINQQITDARGLGVIGALIDKNIYSKISTEHRKLFSMWAVEWIEYLHNEIESNRLLSNEEQFFKLLKRVVEMPRYPLEAPYNTRYFETYKKILLLLKEAQNLIVTDQILVGAPYQGRVVPFLKKGLPDKIYATPTDLVLNGIRDGKGYKYGVLELIDGPDKIYKLKLTGELVIDPLTVTALNTALETKFSKKLEKGSIAGMRYELQAVNSELLNNSDISVSGSLVSLTLSIRQEQLAATMFQLATSGLPFKLRWSLPGTPNQSGELDDIRLRLNKRLGNDLIIDGFNIINPTASKVNISYIKTNKGRIVFLKDVFINNGETYKIAAGLLHPNETFAELPDLAVSFDDGTFEQTINRFLLLESNVIVENITIKNNIPVTVVPSGSELPLQVQSIEVNVELLSNETTPGMLIFHKLLAPFGSFGAESKTSTPRISVQLNKYRVSGKVHFADGGSAPLKNKIFDGSQIIISVDDINFQ